MAPSHQRIWVKALAWASLLAILGTIVFNTFIRPDTAVPAPPTGVAPPSSFVGPAESATMLNGVREDAPLRARHQAFPPTAEGKPQR